MLRSDKNTLTASSSFSLNCSTVRKPLAWNKSNSKNVRVGTKKLPADSSQSQEERLILIISRGSLANNRVVNYCQ